MPELSLADLVRNRTMSPEVAATLANAAAERRSLLFVAIPRMAGKSTVMRAALAYAPAGTAVHELSRVLGHSLGILARADGGYLHVSEVSGAGFDDYLWGADVRCVFAALPAGFALAAALHAGSPREAFEVIAHNGVPDDQAARIELMVYIRSLGAWHQPLRRVVAAVYEVGRVDGGVPETRLLHRWVEADDRFEVAEPPLAVGTSALAMHTADEFRGPLAR